MYIYISRQDVEKSLGTSSVKATHLKDKSGDFSNPKPQI